MSTCALIGYCLQDGERVKAVHVRWDGYPENLGFALDARFSGDFGAFKAFIDKLRSDCRFLKFVGMSEDQDETAEDDWLTSASYLDFDSDLRDAQKGIEQRGNEEYAYIMTNSNGSFRVWSKYYPELEAISLKELLKTRETVWELVCSHSC